MQRRRFLFEHRSHEELGGSAPQLHDGLDMCPVCNVQLPLDDESRAAHVDSCLREQQGGGGGSLSEGGGGGRGGETEAAADSDSESYEEYTWCNTTRIRTTSLLSPQTRASETSYIHWCIAICLVAYLYIFIGARTKMKEIFSNEI